MTSCNVFDFGTDKFTDVIDDLYNSGEIPEDQKRRKSIVYESLII